MSDTVKEIDELIQWLDKHSTSPGNYADYAVELAGDARQEILALYALIQDMATELDVTQHPVTARFSHGSVDGMMVPFDSQFNCKLLAEVLGHPRDDEND